MSAMTCGNGDLSADTDQRLVAGRATQSKLLGLVAKKPIKKWKWPNEHGKHDDAKNELNEFRLGFEVFGQNRATKEKAEQ